MIFHFLFAILISFSALAIEYDIVEGEFDSPLAGGKVPYRAMIPKEIKGKIPVVYFLHGRDGSRHQFRDLGGEELLKRGQKDFAVVTLTGKYRDQNTYWVNDSTDKRFPWKDVVMKEMIPAIEKKHKLGGSTDKRMIAGISMGSHGAWQLALSTGKFRCVAGHSLVVRSFESMTEQFPGKFGTEEEYKKRDPLSILQTIRKRLRLPVKSFWVDIGGSDDREFVRRAKLLETELKRLGVSSRDHVDVGRTDPNGKHDSPYWRKHMPAYLDYYSSCFISP